MALFDFLKRSTKSAESPEQRNYVDYRLGLNLNPREVLVTPDTALTLTAVYAAVRVIAETISQLPLNYYKKTDTGREIDEESSLQFLVHSEPNQMQTKYIFWDTLISTMILYGNAYAYIERDNRGLPLALILLHPDEVKVKVKNGRVTYEVREDSTYDASDILHIPDMTLDGFVGISRISMARDNIALGIAAQTYGKNFFESGGKISGVLRHPGQLGTEAMQALSGQWHSTYHSGYNGSFKTAVLEEGMDYKPIQLAPDQAQFLATRKFSIAEISRLMRVPMHLLGDLEKSSFSNIEQQGIEFVQYCISPILVKIEQELNKKLIFENMKGQRYFEHNINSLMRGDSKTRGDYYAKLFSVGAISPNEIRRKENLNDAKDGDGHYVPMNMIKTDHKPKEAAPKKEIIIEDETEEIKK
jgi:HK97 family phage portal protein|tara:strand:- start:80 stop:1324 length:1245 start_codon:yes stop_codon:yes gene_type:complete